MNEAIRFMLNIKMKNWLIRNPRLNLWNYYTRKKHYSIPFELINKPTFFMRKLPDFLIIGAAKSGTTSLYNYMIQHPKIRQSHVKEISFFDKRFDRGINWYKAYFPITTFRKPFLTGEATAYYLFHSQTAKRVKETLPNVKLIAILRNPIDRLNSLYNMNTETGRETLSIEEAIEKEDERIGEMEKNNSLNNYLFEGYSKLGYSKRYHIHSNLSHLAYKTTGLYSNYLDSWIKIFGREKLLVVTTEDLENNPAEVMKKVFEHLSLPNYESIIYKKHNTRKYDKMNPKTREKLREFFKPYNKKVENQLGMKLHWDN